MDRGPNPGFLGHTNGFLGIVESQGKFRKFPRRKAHPFFLFAQKPLGFLVPCMFIQFVSLKKNPKPGNFIFFPRHPGPPEKVFWTTRKNIPKTPNLRRYDWMSSFFFQRLIFCWPNCVLPFSQTRPYKVGPYYSYRWSFGPLYIAENKWVSLVFSFMDPSSCCECTNGYNLGWAICIFSGGTTGS